MTEYEKELIPVMLEKYESGDYEMLDSLWLDFPQELRLEIIYRAQRDGVKHFTNEERFVTEYGEHSGNSDFEAIIKAVNGMGYDLGLTSQEIKDLHNYMRISDYNSKSVFTIELEKLLMLYRRLREYTELDEKYECLDLNDNKFNFSLMKCDPRRTEARIKFLLELGDSVMPKGANLKGHLTMPSNRFNLRYQSDIERRVSVIEPGSIEYVALAEYVNGDPECAYDKFLEVALMAVYGDKKLVEIIEKKREQVREEILRETEIELLRQDAEKADGIQEPEEFIRIHGMPVESREETERGSGNGHETSNSRLEVFDLQRINEFLGELRKYGIRRIGELETDGGVPAKNKDFVIFQILEVDGCRILEPVGQANNRTYIIRGSETLEEIRGIIETRGRDALVTEGYAMRFNHHRTENQTYDYASQIQKLKNLALLTRELASKRQLDISLEQIRQEVTALIDKGEIPKASSYIRKLKQAADFIFRRTEKQADEPGQRENGYTPPHEESGAGSSNAGEVEF